jgi:hypothetical protein
MLTEVHGGSGAISDGSKINGVKVVDSVAGNIGSSSEAHSGSSSTSGVDGVIGSSSESHGNSGSQSVASDSGSSSSSSSHSSSGSYSGAEDFGTGGVKGGKRRPPGVKGGRSTYG